MKSDIVQLVNHADLHYEGTVPRSEEGLPIGNGRMGTLLWTSPSALKMQVNRIDVYGNGPATGSFNTIHSGYGYACAFADFDFVDYGPDVFDKETRQHLDVYDAKASIKSHGVEIDGFAHDDSDVFAFEVADNRDEPCGINIKLKMLRYTEVQTINHVAISSFHRVGDVMVMRQVFTEGDYYCASAVAIKVVGREGKSRINNENNGAFPILPNHKMPGFGADNETEMRFCLPAQNGSFFVYISSSASFDKNIDVVAIAAATAEQAAQAGYEALFEAHKKWWNDFWEKSFIKLWGFKEAELIEQHYTYYLYIMASCSRNSPFAPNFGGLLFSPRGDMRHWGNMQWWNNLSLTYNAIMPSGHMELIDPYFNMYFNAYDAWATAARQQFGADGIYIGETSHVLGPEKLPEDLAAELRDFMLGRGPDVFSKCSKELQQLAYSRNPFESRWNFRCNYNLIPDFPPYAYVTHLFCSMAFLAYQYYLRFEYTHDMDFLRNVAYPMIRGVSEFFRTYPNTRKEADGKYHIYGTTDGEDYWGAYDSCGSLTAMHGIYPVAIKVAGILGVDAGLVGLWKEFHANLTPLPTNRHPDAPEKDVKYIAKEVWVTALGNGYRKMCGSASVYPCIYMDMCNLQTESVNPEFYKLGRDTVDYLLSLQSPDSAEFTQEMSGWPRIQAGMGNGARLIRNIAGQLNCVNAKDEHAYYEENGSTAPYRNRLTAREGINAMSAQRLGNAAAGLQMGLLQCSGGAPGLPGVIRVFPAWDKGCNAQFELWARDGFKVGAEMVDGAVQPVEITSTLGGECRILNPWGTDVCVKSGDSSSICKGKTLSFDTVAGVTYTLSSIIHL